MRLTTNTVVFGPFQIDVSEQSLWSGGRRLKITTKSVALLQYLVRNAGRVVTKEELLGVVWPSTYVNAGIIKTCVAEIRRVLDDSAHSPRFIEAVPRRGYRFIGSVGIGNVPVPLTSFVGRDVELAATRRLLEYARLVTLSGPAGVGKTRLAIEVAAQIMSATPCAVWWADLSPLADPALVLHTVANVLCVRDYAGHPVIQTVADAVGERRLLLVLDNCEHLIDACAPLVDHLLRACPNLKILATSRQPLGVAGESVCPLAPLSVPESSEGAAEVVAFEAVRLFLERAKDADTFFTISDSNAAAVANICKRLDGLPLAIELAAVRVNVLAPEQIAARLDDVFGLLGHAERMKPPRHQTLRAAFDWSYELLSLKERRLLASLSVFSGSFTLSAVEAVCGDNDEFARAELLDLMARLVDRSLVTRATERSAQEMRYRLLDTVRQYVREKLDPGAFDSLAARHAAFFVHQAEEVGANINDVDSAACIASLDRDRHNLRAALQWALNVEGHSEVGTRLAAALWLYWLRRGQLREGRRWLEAALAHAAGAPPRVMADALCGAGILAWLHGDVDHACRRLQESVALWRTADDTTGLGRALYHLSMPVAHTGDLTTAERLAEEAVELLRGGRVAGIWGRR